MVLFDSISKIYILTSTLSLQTQKLNNTVRNSVKLNFVYLFVTDAPY